MESQQRLFWLLRLGAVKALIVRSGATLNDKPHRTFAIRKRGVT
jgi:hypothetical protein